MDGLSAETVTMRFTVKIDAAKFASRFNIKLPDDSMDATISLPDEERNMPADGGETEAGKADNMTGEVAEDAAVISNLNTKSKCQATLAQCKAKNPLTCPYHGAKAIAQDIEAFIRSWGINGQVNVELDNTSVYKGKQLLSASVTISGVSRKDTKKVDSAMAQFATMPGVESVDSKSAYSKGTIETGFDIDMLDPSAKAQWAAGNKPATPAPTPAATSPQTNPPTAQPQAATSPQNQSQPSVSNQSAPSASTPSVSPASTTTPTTPVGAQQPPVGAQHTSQNAQPGGQAPSVSSASAPAPSPAPSQAPSSAPAPVGRLHPVAPPPKPKKIVPDFTQQDLDDLIAAHDRLLPLAKCLNGRAGDIPKLTNSSRFSSLDALPQDTAFYQRLEDLAKNKNQAVASAASDLKVIADNIASSKKNGWATTAGMMDDDTTFANRLPQVPPPPPEPPKSEAEKRSSALASALAIISSPDNTAPKAEAQKLKKAHEDMEGMENDISALDDAIKTETNPAAKKLLSTILERVENAYFVADKEFKDANAEIGKWLGKQHVMQDSIAETINAIKTRGETPHPYLNNWQKQIDRTTQDANDYIRKKLKLSAAQAANANAIVKKNIRAMYDMACAGDISIATITSLQDFFDMIERDVPAQAPMDTALYRDIRDNCFGTKQTFPRAPNSGGSVFCRARAESMADYDDWWTDQCAIFVDPKKAIIGMNATLYNGGSKYGDNQYGSNLVLMTDANACVLDSDNCANSNKPLFTQDLTGLDAKSFMRKTNLENGNECHVVGGIRKEQCIGVKFYVKVPKFTSAQKQLIRQYGIKVYDSSGKLLTI